jgi:hypothetical protein
LHAVRRDVLRLHFRVLHLADAALSDDVRLWVSGDRNDVSAGLRNADAGSIDNASATVGDQSGSASSTD